MRFSLQPEQRPEPRMRSLSIDEILSLAEKDPGTRPPLENYFSPTKKETFTKDYLHFSMEKHESGMVSEQEAINTFRDELEDSFHRSSPLWIKKW